MVTSRHRAALTGLLLGAIVLAGTAGSGRADSIWARRSIRFGYLFNDLHARNVGDVLTVLIDETSVIDQREQRQLSKASTFLEKFAYAGSTASDHAKRNGSASLNVTNNSTRTFNGSANLTSDRVFTDRITVTVVDVLPNGNLVIEGHRIRQVSGEQRVLRVTGIVRPVDLSPTNTVGSESIANFKLEYFGRGIDTRFTTQGWFSQVLNYVWPF